MTCTQNCNQGRNCTCQEIQLEPLSNWELISYWAVVIASCAFASLTIGLLCGFVYVNFIN
jgi:hypothetical protein